MRIKMDREEQLKELKGLQGWEVYYERRYGQTNKKHYALRHARIVKRITDLSRWLDLPTMTDDFDTFTRNILMEEHNKSIDERKTETSKIIKGRSYTAIVMDDLRDDGKIDIAKLEVGEFSEKLLEKVKEIQAKQKLTPNDIRGMVDENKKSPAERFRDEYLEATDTGFDIPKLTDKEVKEKLYGKKL